MIVRNMICALFIIVPPLNAHGDFSGTLEQESASNTGDNKKNDTQISLEWETGINSVSSLTSISRIRIDSVGDLGLDDYEAKNY
ncbi:MAG: hypothetical protein RPR97_13225, partial [Colwellia sp.]